jgi:hypothetical protein
MGYNPGYVDGKLVANNAAYVPGVGLHKVLDNIETGIAYWVYITSDPLTLVQASGYVSDATFKRLKLGDIVDVFSGTLVNEAAAVPAGVTLGAVTFPGTVGVSSLFTAQPAYQRMIVSAVTAGTTTVSGVATLSPIEASATSMVANFRNLLDGGDFTVNPFQRGTSQAADISSTLTYMADRFFTVGGASSQINWSKQADTAVATFSQALRWQRKAANADTAAIKMGQVVETADSIRAQGQAVTLQFWVKCGANFLASSASFTAQIVSGTGTDQSAANLAAGSWTGQNVVASAVVNPTTSDVLVTLTGVVPAAATQLGVLLSYTPSGTAGANEWLQFKGFQLEIGSGPTVFEHRDVQVELEICQRYFWQINEPAATVVLGIGQCSTTTVATVQINLPVQMRIAPTVAITAGTIGLTVAAGTNQALTTLVALAAGHTVNALGLTATASAANLAAGNATQLIGNGGVGKIAASADY